MLAYQYDKYTTIITICQFRAPLFKIIADFILHRVEGYFFCVILATDKKIYKILLGL